MSGATVSDLQSGVSIGNGTLSGVLKYYDKESDLVTEYGAGNFLALKFTAPEGATVKVGLNPSMGSGMTTLDENMNAVLKIKDNIEQELVVIVSTTDGKKIIKRYDLSGLECRKY